MSEKIVISGGVVITQDPTLKELPQGAVLIEGDTISAVSPDPRAFDGVDARRIDATGGYVLPGMVDSHRHSWMALMRGASVNQSLLQFLATTFYGAGALYEAEDTLAATRIGVLEAIDSGVTTILDCHDCVNSPDHAEADIEALRTSGIRAVYAYGMQVYDYQGTGRFATHADRLAHARDLRSRRFASDDSLLRMGVLVSEFGVYPMDMVEAEMNLVAEIGALGASHTGPCASSVMLRGLRELSDRGLLRPDHLHIHCTALNDIEWKMLADSGGRVSIAPETEMQMGMGHPPLRAALDAGLKPALSTDIVCVGSGDLFSQMRLGLQFQRCLDHDAVHRSGTMPVDVALTVQDALDWGTVNSADALGLGSVIGSLTRGKKADVIVVKPRLGLVRSASAVGSVVLQSAAADVDTVIIDGVVRKADGALVGYDLAAARTAAEQARDRLEAKVAGLPQFSDDEIHAWFLQAEREYSANFATAYRKD